MKIGLYFGSFNPIHVGHLIIASYAAEHTDLDKVWLVVTPQNPHKPEAALLNEYDRLHLVRLAIGDDTRLRASDAEFSLPRPSYTIDTLAYLTYYQMDKTYIKDTCTTIKNGKIIFEGKKGDCLFSHF
jgi:nicotinate-nucleotide adenylyltransferase